MFAHAAMSCNLGLRATKSDGSLESRASNVDVLARWVTPCSSISSTALIFAAAIAWSTAPA
jgi:hypothetical protein